MNSRRKLLEKKRFYLIANAADLKNLSDTALDRILGSGVDIVQLRCKKLSEGIFLRHARRLRRVSKKHGIIFIVNNSADVALRASADGLHIGGSDMPIAQARRIIGKRRILGFSTHSTLEAKKAFKNRALDYIGLGPVFKTITKPKSSPIGCGVVKEVAAVPAQKPFFAIGGIGPKNIARVAASGANRIAVSSAVFNSQNPSTVIRKLRKKLHDTD